MHDYAPSPGENAPFMFYFRLKDEEYDHMTPAQRSIVKDLRMLVFYKVVPGIKLLQYRHSVLLHLCWITGSKKTGVKARYWM